MIVQLFCISFRQFVPILLISILASYGNAQENKTDVKEIVDTEAKVIEYQKNLTDTYADKEKSILSEDDRLKFVAMGGHQFFAYDSNYRVIADLTIYPKPDRIAMKTSTTRIANYNTYGKATFIINGKEFQLLIYQDANAFSNKLYKDHLFIPYTDLTSGNDTYGGGRYLDLMIPKDKTKITIDFNKSYQPYCAYTDGYSCPIPPPENFIDHRIEAGIKHLDVRQLMTSEELLSKSISYHDPENNWNKLDATFEFKTVMADQSERKRTVRINNEKSEFSSESYHEEGHLEFKVRNNNGVALWNGNSIIPKEIAEKYRISNDRAVMYRNYYTYLYGMPMKLKDPGTLLEPNVEIVEFHGKNYNRIKVIYEPEVGTDTWYFYFDVKSNALKAYQFFKDETKNDGEYILFEEIKIIDKVKIPSIRHWYYNKDQKFLATDVIE